MFIGKREVDYETPDWMRQEADTLALNQARMQNELTAAQVAAEKERLKGLANATNGYLSTWNSLLAQVNGSFNTATQKTLDAYKYIDDAQAYLGTLDDIAGEVGAEYERYKADYSPLEATAREGASQELAARSKMVSDFGQYTTPDYEGVSSRAKADVAAEASAARRAEAMRLSGLGIDPTSGMGRSAMTSSFNTEALGRSFAGTAARQAEKERAQNATLAGLQTINPGVPANLALDIRKTGNDLKATQAGIINTGATQRSNIATAAGGLANNLGTIAANQARSVVQPVGEFGAAMLGYQMAPRA